MSWANDLLLFLIWLTGTTLSAPPSLQEGLVAYYSFNKCDARDDSGNGSHGRLNGNVQCWCGIEDNGLLLDGAGAYIEFHGPVNRYFRTSDFSISFYFKPEQYLVFSQSLLSKREQCDEFHLLDLLLDWNQKIIDTRVYELPTKYFKQLSPGFDHTGWIHFALVREGLWASTYLNGQLQRQAYRCSGLDISNEAVLSFSNSPCIKTGKARRFKGVLDELRVYNRALSPEEVQALYDKHPVENAQQDCVTYRFENQPAKLPFFPSSRIDSSHFAIFAPSLIRCPFS